MQQVTSCNRMSCSEEEGSMSNVLGRESVCAHKICLFTSVPKPAMQECTYNSPGDGAYSAAWQREVRPVLDAVVERKIAARLCAGNDIVHVQCIAGIWEGNREHGHTAVLEGSNDMAEGRYDGTFK